MKVYAGTYSTKPDHKNSFNAVDSLCESRNSIHGPVIHKSHALWPLRVICTKAVGTAMISKQKIQGETLSEQAMFLWCEMSILRDRLDLPELKGVTKNGNNRLQ
jgi:hypothetical protein